MISSEKEIGTYVLPKMLISSIIAHKFRYPLGSDINAELCNLRFSLRTQLDIMLSDYVGSSIEGE